MCILVLRNESSLTGIRGRLESEELNVLKRRTLFDIRESLGVLEPGQLLQTGEDLKNRSVIGLNPEQVRLKEGNISVCLRTQIDDVENAHLSTKNNLNTMDLADTCDLDVMESCLETRYECPSELVVDNTRKNYDQVWQDAESMSSQNDASRCWLESVSGLDPDEVTCGEVVLCDVLVPGPNSGTDVLLHAEASGGGAGAPGASGGGAGAPGASGGGAGAPGASGGGAGAPGASGGGAGAPGASGGGAGAPGASGGGAGAPGASGGGAGAPGASGGGAGAPGASGGGAGAPGASGGGAGAPGASGGGAGAPGASGGGAGAPGASGGGAGAPGASGGGAGAPGASGGGAGAPGASGGGAGAPGASGGGAGAPGASAPPPRPAPKSSAKPARRAKAGNPAALQQQEETLTTASTRRGKSDSNKHVPKPSVRQLTDAAAEPRVREGRAAEPRVREGRAAEPRVREGRAAEPRVREGRAAEPRVRKRHMAGPVVANRYPPPLEPGVIDCNPVNSGRTGVHQSLTPREQIDISVEIIIGPTTISNNVLLTNEEARSPVVPEEAASPQEPLMDIALPSQTSDSFPIQQSQWPSLLLLMTLLLIGVAESLPIPRQEASDFTSRDKEDDGRGHSPTS
nr:nascent polypeptide-associated complex subunit alpha, muscle-specific form-like [Procambarus clarkii]